MAQNLAWFGHILRVKSKTNDALNWIPQGRGAIGRPKQKQNDKSIKKLIQL